MFAAVPDPHMGRGDRSRYLWLFAVLAVALAALAVVSVMGAPQASAKPGYRICERSKGSTVYFAQIRDSGNNRAHCEDDGVILGSNSQPVSGAYISCELFTDTFEHGGGSGRDSAYAGDICESKPFGQWTLQLNKVYYDAFNSHDPTLLGPIGQHNF